MSSHPDTSTDGNSSENSKARKRKLRSTNSTQKKAPSAVQKSIQLNRRIIKCGKNEDWSGILEIYDQTGNKKFNYVNYATSLSHLGRLAALMDYEDERLEKLIQDIALQLEQPPPPKTVPWWEVREISNVFHALSKFPLDFYQTSNGAKRLTNIVLTNDRIKTLMASQNIQSIANIAYTCGVLNVPCPALFDSIDEHAGLIVENGKIQEVANTVYACALLGVNSCPSLFQAIDNVAARFVQEGSTQAIANTAWSCGVLGISCPKLFQAIDENASFLVNKGKPQEISSTAYAFAIMDIPCPSLFRKIDKKASYLVSRGTLQAISITIWSAAKLGHEPLQLFACIEERIDSLFERSTAQGIFNIVWAFSQNSFYSRSLLEALDRHVVAVCLPKNGRQIGPIQMQEVSNIALILALYGHVSRPFFDELSLQIEAICHQHQRIDAYCMTIICYSFALLDIAQNYEEEFRLLWSKAIQIEDHELQNEERFQLLQTFVLASRVLEIPPPNKLLHSVKSMSAPLTESQAQQEMSQLLDELGVTHETEASPFPDHTFVPGLLSIDAGCITQRIAIEFDGPSHFLRDIRTGNSLEGIENGPTKAKRRFLERLGWKVVNISFYEWRRAKTREDRKELLAERIRSIVKGT